MWVGAEQKKEYGRNEDSHPPKDVTALDFDCCGIEWTHNFSCFLGIRPGRTCVCAEDAWSKIEEGRTEETDGGLANN